MFAPKAEDVARTDEVGGETNACEGLNVGADEQAAPDTVTVVAESNSTVLTPSGPVELKVDVPFDAPGLRFGVAVGTGAKDDEATIPPNVKLGEVPAAGVPEEVDDGTIPPKLNVLVGGKELNWRLFRLMTGGGAPGALRLTTGGGAPGALRSMTDGEGAAGLRLMTGGLPAPCGPATRPAPEGLFREMMLGDGAGFIPPGGITPRCNS